MSAETKAPTKRTLKFTVELEVNEGDYDIAKAEYPPAIMNILNKLTRKEIVGLSNAVNNPKTVRIAKQFLNI